MVAPDRFRQTINVQSTKRESLKSYKSFILLYPMGVPIIVFGITPRCGKKPERKEIWKGSGTPRYLTAAGLLAL
jgi:hypothetical protein